MVKPYFVFGICLNPFLQGLRGHHAGGHLHIVAKPGLRMNDLKRSRCLSTALFTPNRLTCVHVISRRIWGTDSPIAHSMLNSTPAPLASHWRCEALRADVSRTPPEHSSTASMLQHGGLRRDAPGTTSHRMSSSFTQKNRWHGTTLPTAAHESTSAWTCARISFRCKLSLLLGLARGEGRGSGLSAELPELPRVPPKAVAEKMPSEDSAAMPFDMKRRVATRRA